MPTRAVKASRRGQPSRMIDLIPIGRHGISHVLTASADRAPCPDPHCHTENLIATEIVYDDQTAELWYDGCDHEYLSEQPRLGETVTRRT